MPRKSLSVFRKAHDLFPFPVVESFYVRSGGTCRPESLDPMKNPWLKKNPLMSMWLSGVNAVAGSARRRIMAESRRQSSAMMTKGMKQVNDFWSGMLLPKPPAKRKKKRP